MLAAAGRQRQDVAEGTGGEKMEPSGATMRRAVLVHNPDDDICCGVELTPTAGQPMDEPSTQVCDGRITSVFEWMNEWVTRFQPRRLGAVCLWAPNIAVGTAEDHAAHHGSLKLQLAQSGAHWGSSIEHCSFECYGQSVPSQKLFYTSHSRTSAYASVPLTDLSGPAMAQWAALQKKSYQHAVCAKLQEDAKASSSSDGEASERGVRFHGDSMSDIDLRWAAKEKYHIGCTFLASSLPPSNLPACSSTLHGQVANP